MKRLFFAIVFCVVPAIVQADSGDTATVEMFSCALKEGKTMEEVQANNTKWLALTRKTAGSEDVNSYALEPVVGEISKFVFVDVYPTMASWAAAKSANTDEGKAIEETFNELMDCAKNRLYNSTQH